MSTFTTPAPDFYRVDISLVTPHIDASTWSLTLNGMVDRPLTLTYDELLAMPLVERDITLTCVSNEVGGPYVSTGRWLGVPFRDLIERVGVHWTAMSSSSSRRTLPAARRASVKSSSSVRPPPSCRCPRGRPRHQLPRDR